jgi:hypothetical protein
MKNEKRVQRSVSRPWFARVGECVELAYLSTVSRVDRACFLAVSRTKRAWEKQRARRSCRKAFFRLRIFIRTLFFSKAESARRMAVQTLVLAALFLLLTGLVFGIAHTVSAREQRYTKYITCITIEDGDSLWRIAERYMTDGYSDIPSFIEEIRFCNKLYGDEIHAGEKLLVPYFVPVR